LGRKIIDLCTYRLLLHSVWPFRHENKNLLLDTLNSVISRAGRQQ
jgi:hypothetical protein